MILTSLGGIQIHLHDAARDDEVKKELKEDIAQVKKEVSYIKNNAAELKGSMNMLIGIIQSCKEIFLFLFCFSMVNTDG